MFFFAVHFAINLYFDDWVWTSDLTHLAIIVLITFNLSIYAPMIYYVFKIMSTKIILVYEDQTRWRRDIFFESLLRIQWNSQNGLELMAKCVIHYGIYHTKSYFFRKPKTKFRIVHNSRGTYGFGYVYLFA